MEWRENPEIWEDEIRSLESDELGKRLVAPIVFTGSSSIRMWTTLEKDFAPLPVLNRGFGGAQMDAVLFYAPRIVLPHRPRAVVLYAGENDLEPHNRKEPEDVVADVRAFADALARAVPSARLYLISLKPSPARLDDWSRVRRFNALLEAFAADDDRRAYVDIATASFDAAGQRRRDLYLDDGLHLSSAGYRLWASILRPRLLGDVATGKLAGD